MALCLFISLMRALFACVSRIFNGEDVRRISVDSFGEERGEIYQTMPSARKEEIDNLRKNALIRYMSRFTLVRQKIMCRWTKHWIILCIYSSQFTL